MSFVIEKNVPIPTTRGKYPFGAMQVGESFVADEKARRAMHVYMRRSGSKFIARKEGDKFRIWRTA